MNFLEKASPKVRKEERNGKRAVFLTITLVLFALILFSLSSLFLSQKQSENFFVQGSIDRVVNLDASIQKSITDLFEAHSGIAIVISSNKIIINEILPPSFSDFESKLGSFESFIESELSIVTINADVNTMPLNLTPIGIVYNHSTVEEKVIIQRVELASAFEIKFTFPQGEEGITCPLTWNRIASGNLRVKVIAEDIDAGSCNTQSDVNPLDSTGSEVEIIHARGNIKVKIANNVIEISRVSSNAYVAETTIELAVGEKIVSIKMPEIVTDVSLLNFGIVGEARFLT